MRDGFGEVLSVENWEDRFEEEVEDMEQFGDTVRSDITGVSGTDILANMNYKDDLVNYLYLYSIVF